MLISFRKFSAFSFPLLTICFAIPLLMFLLHSNSLRQQMMPSSKEPIGIQHLLRRNYSCSTIALVTLPCLMSNLCCKNNVNPKWDWNARNVSSLQSTTSVPILIHHSVLPVSFQGRSVKHLRFTQLESPSQLVVQAIHSQAWTTSFHWFLFFLCSGSLIGYFWPWIKTQVINRWSHLHWSCLKVSSCLLSSWNHCSQNCVVKTQIRILLLAIWCHRQGIPNW